MIIATCGCGAADTTAAIVETPVLEQITIAPKTVSLQTGGSQTFTSTARWSNDETTLPPVTYSRVGGGTINATSGAYTAPGSAGTYLVIVAPQGSGLRDTAVVTVTAAPPPPPPPPPPSEFASNLPSGAGLQLVTDTYFGNMLPNEQFSADGLAYAWDGRNATDASATYGPAVFENFYPGNSRGDGSGGAIMWGPEDRNWRKMYFSIMLWVPSNYSMHTNEEKFFYPLVKNGSSVTSSTIFGWYLTGNESASGQTWSLGVDPQLGAPRTYQTSNVKLQKGTWQRLEFFVQMNTPGQSNGIWRAWINGVLAVDFSNIRYSNASTQSTFNGIRFTGTRGGGPSSALTPAGGQVRRYSRLAFYASQN
jgi:hypothetical protein